MKDITGNTLRGHLETLVLAILEKGEAHGFEILRRLKEESAGALNLKEGSLYPALYRLEEMGCIAGNWEGESEERARGQVLEQGARSRRPPVRPGKPLLSVLRDHRLSFPKLSFFTIRGRLLVRRVMRPPWKHRGVDVVKTNP